MKTQKLPKFPQQAIFASGLLLFCGLFSCLPGAPPTNPDQKTNSKSIWGQANILGTCGGLRDQLSTKGVNFTASYDSEVMGNPYGGNFGHGAVYNGLLTAIVDVDLEKLAGWQGGTFRASGFWTHGESLTQKYVGDFSVVSNVDAYDTVRLDELWLQQSFLGDAASLKVGQLTVDSEFFVTNSGALFFNSTFGALPFVGSNFSPYSPPIYPVATPGVRLHIQPIPQFYFQSAAFTGDTGSQQENNHGTLFNFEPKAGALIFNEAGFLLNQGKDDKGLAGTYRIGSWLHSGEFSTFPSQTDVALGRGSLQTTGTRYGIYGVVDQAVLKFDVCSNQAATVNLFARVGFAPSNSSTVPFDLDGGVNVTGLVPGRKDDLFGIGLARTAVSRDFSDFSVAQGGPAFSYEAIIETTYAANVAPWWTIQPDIQYVFNAGATTKSPDALVLGLRTTFTF